MNNDDDILVSLIDTIELFLQEASTSDNNTQFQLLLQTDSFFQKVIKISQESPEFPRVLKCIHSYIHIINSNLSLFLSDRQRSKTLTILLILFSNSSFASQISIDISNFTNTFLLLDDLSEDTITDLTPFLHIFFTSPVFAQPFESIGGLICLWKLIINPSKINLFEIIFSDLQQTINYYFQSIDSQESNDFFAVVIGTIKDIPIKNAIKAFQFINGLITASQSKELIPFINQGGFQAFNQYIISHDNPKLLTLYHMFMPICTSPNDLPKCSDEVHPILGQLIKLFEFPKISEPIQLNAMILLLKSLQIFSKEYCPIQPESLYIIASSIKPNQKELALLFFQISHYLITHFNFDITLTIPLLFPFYNYDFFMNNEVQCLFEVLKLCEESFMPFVPIFFASITKDITPERFFNLVKRYPMLLYFMDIYCNDKIFDDHLLTLFYSISPLIKKREMYSKVLIQLLLEEEKVDFLFKFLTTKDKTFSDSILNEIAQLFCFSRKLRNCPHSICFLNKMNYDQVSPSTIFNVIIGLSGKFYSQQLDTFVIIFLKKHNFFKMTKDDIKKLAFGVFLNQPEKENNIQSEHLIFPSLLPFCGDDFKIVFPFDKWICGQYGIDLWLTETGQTIDKFPTIASVASRFLLPKHVPMIFKYPKIINDSSNNSFQMIPTFEFANNLENTMISFQMVEIVKTVSFWFSINTLPTEKVRIVSFFNCNLVVYNKFMNLNESEPCNVTANRWYHVILIANDKLTSCTAYINGKQVLQCNIPSENDKNYSFFDIDFDGKMRSKKPTNNLKNKLAIKCSNLKFGMASMNPIQWYIGGAIRVYSQALQNDTIEELFTSGVINIMKNTKPFESLFITANNFVNLFEGSFNTKLASQCLSENSRPAISFSFLRHLQNAYNGGECILNLIMKQIQSGNDESVECLINTLCKMQNLNFTNWELSHFALHMSTLFYLRPSLFNENILTNIFCCFSSDMEDIIDWEDILIFIFDFGLFNTPSRSFAISKLFEFTAQYGFDENISANALNFIFHVLFIFDKDLDDSEFEILFSLIDKFHPMPTQVSYMLQASLNYNENLANPSLQYNKELFEGRLYNRLFEMFIKTVDEKFCDYHLIFILQPLHSIKLIETILHLTTKKKIPPNNINQMIIFCLSHSELKETWPILFNLLLTVKTKKYTGQYIELIETLIPNSQIDSESLYRLVIALSFLSIQVLNQPKEELEKKDNFWMNLWNILLTFTMSNSSMFNSDVLSSKKVTVAILQLVSLGFFTPERTIFPFCPSLDNPDEIIKYCILPGQPFPTAPCSNKIRANMVYIPKSGNDIWNSITRIIPQIRHLPPPYSESSITSHKKMYDINFVNKAMEANKATICMNWHKFIPKPKYSVETALESSIFTDIIAFVAKVCTSLKLIDPNMKRASPSNEFLSLLDASGNNSSASLIDSSSNLSQSMNDDDNDDDDEIQNTDSQNDLLSDPATNASASQHSQMDFNRFFLSIVTLCGSLNTKYSMKFISTFVIEILKYMTSRKKIGYFILRFICARILSGWFEHEFLLEIITYILSFPIKGKDKSMTNILQILIFASKNIPQKDLPNFFKLFNTQSDKIFIPTNFEYDWFIVLLFELLNSNKTNQDCSEQITSVTKTFSDTLKQSCKKIKDKNVLQMRNAIISGLLELNNPSKRSSYEPDEYLSQLITEKKEEFLTKIQNSILSSLKRDIINRAAQTAQFYQNVNEFLDVFNSYDVYARSVSSIIRFDDRRLLLFDLNCFFRLREKVLSSFPFADDSTFKEKATTKTVSLLNDPIFPTRRFERSPMIYNIPPFSSASKNVVSVMPYPLPEYQDILTILPRNLYDLLTIDYRPFEVMVLHQLKPHVLSFSYHFEIDDALLLSVVLNFVTCEKSSKLKFMGEASILYGISPLKGVLIIDSKNIYFLEGLKLTADGCTFNDDINKDMNDIIYDFYISYLDAGYFGQPYMFCGHPLIQLPISQIILSTPHLWLQKEIAIELNFLLGWTFIIVAKSNDDYLTLNKTINEFVENNVGKMHYYNKFPSPINTVRLLRLSVREVSKLWTDGHISNYTYLLYLNKISGRSFVDFSQFNVFPWIISDYSTSVYESIPKGCFRDLSLPMGQIGPERTPRFELFFETSKYFYGTHYMHIGVVLFYLFRIDPFCLFSIYFHHGWDHPDRLFTDFGEAWLSASHVSQNDVKEVVPQLFKSPEFLLNLSHLPLSVQENTNNNQDSSNIENVKFGKWANNSRDFTRIMSTELESERVSRSLNLWIDLIFGIKSRGEPAIEAKNVFPPLCYSDNNSSTSQSANTNSNSNQSDERNLIDEEVEKKATEASIINFGQCPRQLFKNPHPIKNKIEPRTHLLSDPRLLLYHPINCDVFLPSSLPANDIYVSSTNIFIAPQNGIVLNSTTTIQFSYDMSSIISYGNSVYNPVSNSQIIKTIWRVKQKGFGRSNQRSNSLIVNEPTSTDDDTEEIEDDGQVRLPSSPTSSLPTFVGVLHSQHEEAPPIDSSLSSSYMDFSNLVETIDGGARQVQPPQPSPLAYSDSEERVVQTSELDLLANGRSKVVFKCSTSVKFVVKSSDGSLLSLFLKEGGFSVFSLVYEKGEVKSGFRLARFSTRSSEIVTAAVSAVNFLAIVVCDDETKGRTIARYDLGLMAELAPIEVHFTVRKLAFDDQAATIIACGESDIAIFSVSGDQICTQKVDGIITSLTVSNLDESVRNRFFVTGHADGFVRFWTLNLSASKIDLLKEVRVCGTQIDLLAVSSDDEATFESSGNALRAVAVASHPTSKMFAFEFSGSNAKCLKRDYAAKCAICGKKFDEKQKPNACVACHRFFCKECAAKNDKKNCKNCQEIRAKIVEGSTQDGNQ